MDHNMIINGELLTQYLNNFFIGSSFKIGFILLAVLFFIFCLIVVGQVRLMTQTVSTEAGPLLRFFSVLFAGIALGLIVFFIAFL